MNGLIHMGAPLSSINKTSIWPVGFLWQNQYIWTVSIHIFMCVGVVEYTHMCTLKSMHIKLAVSYIQYFQLSNVWIMSYKQKHSLIATHQHKSCCIIGGTQTIIYVVPRVANAVWNRFFVCLKICLHDVSPRKSELSKTKILPHGIHVHSTYIFGGESSDLKRTYPYPPAGVSSFFVVDKVQTPEWIS
jgi:hypothetical protein